MFYVHPRAMGRMRFDGQRLSHQSPPSSIVTQPRPSCGRHVLEKAQLTPLGGIRLVQAAMVVREAVAPGLLVGFAGILAGPHQGLAAGQPVAEAIATVATATAADQPLLGRPLQPA